MALAYSKITAQGQISVPAEVRRKLGLGPGSVLEWEEEHLRSESGKGGWNSEALKPLRDAVIRTAKRGVGLCGWRARRECSLPAKRPRSAPPKRARCSTGRWGVCRRVRSERTA